MSSFGKTTAGDLDAVVHNLLDLNMRGLVLDLRDCPGGLLNQAVQVADLFVNEGTIVSVSGRGDIGQKRYDARGPGTYGGFPIAVLVNGSTASAGEIVAACLQDHQRAKIVGERTYGRGIVQGIFPLSSGGGALKLRWTRRGFRLYLLRRQGRRF